MDHDHDEGHHLQSSLGLIYNILSALVIPLAFVVLVLTMPVLLQKRKTSSDNIELTYWNLRVLGYGCAIFGLFSMVVLFFFNICTTYELHEYWPGISRWIGLGSTPGFSIGYDLFGYMVIYILSGAIAPLYGSHNDMTFMYTPPEWHARKRHIADVDARLAAIKAQDPSKYAYYQKISKDEQDAAMRTWEYKVREAEFRRTNVYKMYKVSV